MEKESTIHLYTYSNMAEATAVREKLKNAGIDSFIEKEDEAALKKSGDIKVSIFSKDMEAAEKIISSI